MKYNSYSEAIIMLENGSVYKGFSIGKKGTTGGEICFNTGMTGYQEIYTDPSYYGQIVVNTNSHIGNYGVIDKECESSDVKINGLIIKTYSDTFSRSDAQGSLQEYLEKAGIIGICNVDTRKLVREIRNEGAMNVIISTEIFDEKLLREELAKLPNMEGLSLADKVSTKEIFYVGDENAEHKVSVLDIGIKRSILTNLASRGCYCKVFPHTSTFEEMAEWNPDAYFVSNGPGDPAVMLHEIEQVKKMINSGLPVFGICLGHQMIALASGISTYKMHNGHRGLNHPVKNLKTGLSEITSQNHGFSISAEDVAKNPNVEATHINLNDHTIAGIRLKDKKVFSVQYHPESSPGPHDSRYLFDDFVKLIAENKQLAE